MKIQEHRIEDREHSRFEADLEAGIEALFRRCPTLCGFAVRDATNLFRDALRLEHVSALVIAEISVYPLSGLSAPAALGDEIVAALVELIDECPGACELLRERSFARVYH